MAASAGERMNAAQRIEALRSAAMQRQLAIVLGCAAAPLIATVIFAAHAAGVIGASAVAVFGVVAIAAFVRHRMQRIDAAWIARRLDASLPAMDDSAALLSAPEGQLTRMQQLQRERLQTRIANSAVDLRPVWPQRVFAASALLALVLLALAASWPTVQHARDVANAATQATTHGNATTITQTELAIDPPAYTKLPSRKETSLDAKAPEGSHLHWSLHFDPQPSAASLQFHDGRRIALARNGDLWAGEDSLAASALYRVVLEGAPAPADDRLHRLDAIADQPPDVRVTEPQKTLNLLDAQQKTWNLAFEASDDYGIAGAELQLTLAQGSGENIKFKEQTIALHGEPVATDDVAKHQGFHYALDLATLGLAKGDDVIVRIAVTDNREPKPNVTRSASFILRWPADASSDSSGLEGIAQKVMPAYFRSERQIIIDTEALIADKPTIADAKFLSRSDGIGVDQKILRLRYGQFLGEESETHAEQATELASGDHGKPTQVDALAAAHEAQERKSPADANGKFGVEGNTVAEYGHVHDIAEAATLLDPETKATLKTALDAMWQSELNLRQGRPNEALPYEHTALDVIKQVQQSTRIYLARVGLELPTPDEARRLSGDRKGLTDRVGTLAAAHRDDEAIVQFWHALSGGTVPDWSAAETWLHAHAANSPDALGVVASIDAARRDPACVACRTRLRDLLWPLLPTPAAASVPRSEPDAAGRAYLDALRASSSTESAR
jgi:hypothetical protein